MARYERFVVYPLLFIALFCSLTGVSVVKASQEVLEKVITKELVVVNDAGKEIASIRSGNDPSTGVELCLNDADGAMMITLGVGSLFGSRLILYTQEHREGAALYGGFYGAELVMNYEGESRVSLRTLSSHSDLTFYSHLKPGEIFPKPDLVLGSRLNDGGFLDVYNDKGDRRASIFKNTGGHGGIWLYDKYGEQSRAYTFY